MGADTKEMIAAAARRLMMRKCSGKLTVKEIVNECHITRQAFYYHFEDVPTLLQWMLEQDEEKMIREALRQGDEEHGLLYLFQMAAAVAPYIRKGMQTNYRNELQKLLLKYCQRFFEEVIAKEQFYPNVSPEERRLFIRYHSYAIIGLLQGWTEEDTQNLESIVHSLHRLMIGEVKVRSDCLTK